MASELGLQLRNSIPSTINISKTYVSLHLIFNVHNYILIFYASCLGVTLYSLIIWHSSDGTYSITLNSLFKLDNMVMPLINRQFN